MTWRDFYTTAALAGVAIPLDHSLRELVWMADARELAEWDRVAWLCLHIPYFGRGRRSFVDVHPIRKQKHKVNVGALLTNLRESSKAANLPKTLSEDEIEARWQRYITNAT